MITVVSLETEVHSPRRITQGVTESNTRTTLGSALEFSMILRPLCVGSGRGSCMELNVETPDQLTPATRRLGVGQHISGENWHEEASGKEHCKLPPIHTKRI